MATMEPTEDEISQVIDFAGLDRMDDRGMVIQALKVAMSLASYRSSVENKANAQASKTAAMSKAW